jgi:hypothetical protein
MRNHQDTFQERDISSQIMYLLATTRFGCFLDYYSIIEIVNIISFRLLLCTQSKEFKNCNNIQ